MAIKSISQLDQFNNGESSQYAKIIGGNLRLYKETVRSNEDFIDITSHGAELQELSTTYRHALFEISQPQLTDKSKNEFYYSKHIPYSDLAKNIIADAKQYLNAHNGLFDNDIEQIAHDDYAFTGHKLFSFGGSSSQGKGGGGVEILCGLTADFVNITNGLTCTIPGNTRPILFDASLSVKYDLICNNLTVNNNCKFNCDINAPGFVVNADFLSGGAYCLKDNKTTYTNVPAGYTTTTKVGNPVCFVNGKPQELTSVSMAEKAKTLVNSSGTEYTIGYGAYRTNGATRSESRTSQSSGSNTTYSAVFLRNGIPYTTNVIDYAEHAYWSDLGEKYLGEEIYDPGTLVKFGGKNEITIADTEVNAIVSTKAFDLNAGLKDGTVIALCGRVPTKVVGKIKKFDKIVLSSTPGVARRKKWYDIFKRTIGRSLESNDDDNIKLVECVTRFIV